MGASDADKKLRLAERNIERAKRSLRDDDADQSVINAETAVVNAADAVLALYGYRLRGKTWSHEARLAFPKLPPEFARQRERLEAIRRVRSMAMYDVSGAVSREQAEGFLALASELVNAASRELAANSE